MGLIDTVNKLLPGNLLAKNITYGNMFFDVYGHKSDIAKPVIVFWHGGGWKSGDKKHYAIIARNLQKLDAIVVTVGYPLYPQQTFPGFIHDAKQTIVWVKQNAQAYGGDPKRIFTMGHSSGAHTATIVTLQDDKSDIAGCIALATPCTILKKYYSKVFNGAFDLDLQNPITHIGPNKHPFLLIHGRKDRLVKFADGERLYASLRKARYPVQLIAVSDLGHANILATLVRPFSYKYEVMKNVKHFIQNN